VTKPVTRAEKARILRPKKKSVWVLHDALQFVRRLEKKLRIAYAHVAFTGSVLYEGESRKDLDIVIFPHSSRHFDLDLVRGVLEEAGLHCLFTVAQVHKDWRERGIKDRKRVEIWAYRQKRVDVMFLK
jgi:hypothetical protein